MSLKLSRSTCSLLVLLGLLCWWAWLVPGLADPVRARMTPALWWTLAGACAAVLLVLAVRVQDRTLTSWAVSRLRVASPSSEVTRAALYGADGRGLLWDGTYGSLIVEVSAPPWRIVRLDASGMPEMPALPTEAIRASCLTQYDLPVDHIDIVTTGEWFLSGDRATAVLASAVGAAQLPLSGKAWIKVAVKLSDAMFAVAERTRNGEIPDGLARAVHIAAFGVARECERAGFTATIASASRVRALHDHQMRRLAPGLAFPHWGFAGRSGAVSLSAYFLPPKAWSPEAIADVGSVSARTQYLALRMSRTDHARKLDRMEFLAAFATSDRTGTSGAAGAGLRRLSGQHRAALARWLPEAAEAPLQAPGAVVRAFDEPQLGIPVGGLGVFLGPNKERQRVFLTVAPSDVPLYIGGPEAVALQFVFRLAAQPVRIGVSVDTPGWKRLVAERQSDNLVFDDGGDFDAVVLTEEQYETRKPKGKIIIVVVDDLSHRTRPDAYLTAQNSTGVVGSLSDTGADQEKFKWTVTPAEEPWVGRHPGPGAATAT